MRNFLAKGGFFHKKVSQSLERRFVGFVKPSNRRSFCVSGQIKGGSPERSSICENQQGHWRGGSMSDSQRPTSRARRSRYSAMSTSGVRAVPTHATASSAGIGTGLVCGQISPCGGHLRHAVGAGAEGLERGSVRGIEKADSMKLSARMLYHCW